MKSMSKSASAAMVLALVALGGATALRDARAEWPACGRAISAAQASQVHSAITTDGVDGAIVTWQDARSNRVNIFAGHVLASGELDLGWPVNGQALLTDSLALANADGGQFAPVIVSDGVGGAIVAWQDLRSAVTEFDVFAQHVLADGVVDRAWPANGRALVTIAGQQSGLVMVPDGSGGAIVAWEDTRPGASEVDLYAQHVLATGIVDPAWPVNGLAVVTAAGRQKFPAIVADAAGGAIVAWEDKRSGGLDVYAQRLLLTGTVDPAWPADGRAVCTAAGDQGRVTIAPDGAHGAIIAWGDSRVVGTSHIFAQHVLGSGLVDPAWPVNGRAISSAGVLESRPLVVSDGAGGAIVNWQAFTIHLFMVAQHVTAAGIIDPLWPAGGRVLSDTTRTQFLADIVPDGAGGAVVAWQDSFDVVAQHVLATGALDPAYPDTGLALCTFPSQEGDVAVAATSGGGAIVSWTDTRNGKDADIYAMQVTEAVVTLDAPPGSAPAGVTFAPPRPNPARGSMTLRFSLPREAHVRLAIYDVSGRRVRGLVSGPQPAGEHALTWDMRDDDGRVVGAGLYFARLETEGRIVTTKLTRLR